MQTFPVALAPGMGMNAFFAYTVVLVMGYSWQQALAGIFVSGILFILLSATGLRELIINSIPTVIKTCGWNRDWVLYCILRIPKLRNYCE